MTQTWFGKKSNLNTDKGFAPVIFIISVLLISLGIIGGSYFASKNPEVRRLLNIQSKVQQNLQKTSLDKEVASSGSALSSTASSSNPENQKLQSAFERLKARNSTIKNYFVKKITGDDYSFEVLGEDGSLKETLYAGKVSSKDPQTGILSPDKKYSFMNGVGIIDLTTNKTSTQINKEGKNFCRWFPDSHKLACYGYLELGSGRNKEWIKIINLDGSEQTIKQATITYGSDKSRVDSSEYLDIGSIIGIRNEKEILIASNQKGFIKLNIDTKQADTIISKQGLNVSIAPVAYSNTLDQLIYINRLDNYTKDSQKYTTSSPDRYVNKLYIMNLKDGQIKTLWEKFGFYKPEAFALSVDGKKLIFEKQLDDMSKEIDVYYIVDLISGIVSEITNEQGGESTHLLGFSADEQGALVSQYIINKMDEKGNIIKQNTYYEVTPQTQFEMGRLYRVIYPGDKPSIELFRNTCILDDKALKCKDGKELPTYYFLE